LKNISITWYALDIDKFLNEGKNMTLEQEVINIVAEQLGVDKTEVTPAKSFVEDLNADSLDLTELIMTLEEKFDVEISEDKAEKLKTVKDVIDFISTIKASK
jgi:acyl carrier protein